MKRIATLVAAASMLVGLPVAAETREDEQVWINITAMGSLKGKLIYFAEVQPRFGDGVSRLDQLLLRPAVGWQVSRRLALYQGYVRVVLPVTRGPDNFENRSFQQVSWTLPPSRRGEVSLRSRFEQRWRSDGNDMGLRVRQMLRGEYALASSGRGVRALGYAELFVALKDTDWGARSGFDQLRSFVGAELPVGGKSTVEAGYLNQFIHQGAVKRVNHVASLSLFLRR